MERHAKIFKPQRGNISELMIYLGALPKSTLTIDRWVDEAIQAACYAYGIKNIKPTRERRNQEPIYCIMNYAYGVFPANLKQVGAIVAFKIGRNKPYNHTTVLYARKYHVNALRFNRQYETYSKGVESFRKIMHQKQLL